MNMLTMAQHSIHKLAQTLRLTQQARDAFTARLTPPLTPPCRTQVVAGAGMVRVVELGTGRVLGFRRTIKEAHWLAAQLERGERPQVAA